jgi:hypothetical protein
VLASVKESVPHSLRTIDLRRFYEKNKNYEFYLKQFVRSDTFSEEN